MANFILDKSGKKHYIPVLWDASRSRVTFGNEKTGLPGLMLLAGSDMVAYSGSVPAVLRPLFGACCGTCPGDCPGCYAKKITRNIDPAVKCLFNTLEAKTDPARFVGLYERELFSSPVIEYKVVRLHDSGEFFSTDYVAAIMDMIRRHPRTTFYTYSKQYENLRAYGLDRFPDNFTLNCSPWRGVCGPLDDFPQFIWDDGSDPEIALLPHCPAVGPDGKRTGITCAQCLHCAHAKHGDRWAVYDHN